MARFDCPCAVFGQRTQDDARAVDNRAVSREVEVERVVGLSARARGFGQVRRIRREDRQDETPPRILYVTRLLKVDERIAL